MYDNKDYDEFHIFTREKGFHGFDSQVVWI